MAAALIDKTELMSVSVRINGIPDLENTVRKVNGVDSFINFNFPSTCVKVNDAVQSDCQAVPEKQSAGWLVGRCYCGVCMG